MGNIKKQLEKITDKVSGVASLDGLFNNDFMKDNTEFEAIEELFQYCKLDIKTQKDFDEIAESGIDEVIKEKTKFQSWKEMLGEAGREEMIKRLNNAGLKTK